MLIYPKPYAHETLLSFVYRVAQQNLMDPSWIFHILENRYSIKLIKNMVNWLNGEELEALANFLRLPIEQAKALSISFDLERIGLGVWNVKKNPWFLYDKTRFCPICLDEDSFQRKIWISSHSIICLEHKRFLIDKCTNCHNIINTRDIIQNICPKCNKFLSFSQNNFVKNNSLIQYQKLLNNIYLKNSFEYEHSWINNSATFLNALDFLSIWAAKLVKPDNLSIHDSNIFYKGSILERNHLKNYRTLEQSICIYNFVFNIIKNWPTAFYQFLEMAEENNEQAFFSFLKYGITKLIGTDLWPISKEVTNFISKNRIKLKGDQFIRSDEIKYINTKFNGGIIYSEVINSEPYFYKGLKFNIIEKSEVDKLLDEFENSYTKEEIMTHWGLSSKAAFNILNSNLIEGTHCYKIGSASTWIIPIKSINSIESKLEESDSQHVKLPISLGNSFQWAGPHHAALILRGMLSGKIKFKLNGPKLTNTLIDKRDCYFYLKEIIINQSFNSGSINIRDIIFILGIKKSDVIYWLETGRLGEFSNTTDYVYLPVNNFLTFLNHYITTFELSIELNLHTKKILKQHSMGNLNSISGPELNDGKRLLFYRKDINYKIFNRLHSF
ncbi:TniQ family protein [Ferdinandcohnia sp. SAFN-114]|uniref:TniQ family protein n=1 Tax=Ferdinandcohnia sp. SAFN-114 TaxID=3387275 RepID=UPI003F7D2FEE